MDPLYPNNLNALRHFSDLTPNQLLMLQAMGFAPSSAPSMASGGFNSPQGRVFVQGTTSGDRSVTMGNFALPVELTQGLTVTPTAHAMVRQGAGFSGADVTPGMDVRMGPVSVNASRQFSRDGRNATNYGVGANVGPVQASYTRAQPDQGKPMNIYGLSGEVAPGANIYGTVSTGDPRGTKYQGGIDVQNILRGLFSAGVELTPEQKAFAFYGRYTGKF